MKGKLTKEDLDNIRLLLKSKPIPEDSENKKWIDNHVKSLLKKYKKSNKIF